MTREQAEQGLTLLGVLVLENRLKPQTAGVLAALQRAQVEVNMVTGDHVLTGVTVSRNCGARAPRHTRMLVLVLLFCKVTLSRSERERTLVGETAVRWPTGKCTTLEPSPRTPESRS